MFLSFTSLLLSLIDNIVLFTYYKPYVAAYRLDQVLSLKHSFKGGSPQRDLLPPEQPAVRGHILPGRAHLPDHLPAEDPHHGRLLRGAHEEAHHRQAVVLADGADGRGHVRPVPLRRQATRVPSRKRRRVPEDDRVT